MNHVRQVADVMRGDPEAFMVVGPCPVCGGSRVELEYEWTEGHWAKRNVRICSVCRIGIHTPGRELDGRPRVGMVKAIGRPPQVLAAGRKFENRY